MCKYLGHYLSFLAQIGRSMMTMIITLGWLSLQIILMKDKYCLDSIASFSQINQSPTNKSGSKQTFSFSRSPRFQSIKANCPMSTYGRQRFLRKDSGAGIGYGKKYDFTINLANSPSSSKYELKTIFDVNREKAKGSSIGTSRDKVVFDSYIDAQKLRNPGVARYSIETQNGIRSHRAPAFSMREKTKLLDKTKTVEAQNDNPGPADYQNNPQLSKTLYSSHFSKIGYSHSKSKRFLNPDNKIPGPSYYENPTSLSNVGKYVMSIHRGGTNAKFDSSPRITKFQEAARVGLTRPGPGYYRASSEFGHYDGNVYNILTSTSRKSIKK